MAVYKRGNVWRMHRWTVAVASTSLLCIAQQVPKLLPPLSKGVVLVISIDLPGRLPVIKGRTNLPDDTQIMTSVTCGRPCRAVIDGHKYMGQIRTVVQNGQFTAGPFSMHSLPLPSGHYIADVVMPYSSLQSAEVRAIIGDLGEKLSGPLVKRNPQSGFPLDATVSVSRAFQIIDAK